MSEAQVPGPPIDVPPPPPTTAWDIGGVLSRGWTTLKARPESIAVVFVALLLASAIPFAWGVYRTIHDAGQPQPTGLAEILGQIYGNFLKDEAVGLLNVPISAFFTMNLVRYLLAVARNQPAGFADLFRGRPYYLSFLGAVFLFNVAVNLGIVLCVVPGIVLALGWFFYGQLIVDRNLRAVDSLRESWRLTSGHKWMLLAYAIVIGLLQIAGVIACCVGVLVTMTLMCLANTFIYLHLTGTGPASPPPSAPAAP